MKLWWKIAIGMMVLGVGLAAFLFIGNGAAQRTVAEARQALRRQGFKTDLADFDFSTSPELRQREQALTNAVFNRLVTTPEAQARRSILQQEDPQLMQMVMPDAAATVWKRARLPSREVADLWPGLREIFSEDREALDAAATAALSGPIRFELNASHGMAMLLRHLASLKSLARTFGQHAVVELHDGDVPAAWTNLLAATRLVTAWEVEPSEISHLVRFACADIVFNITWEMMQTNAWTEAQLHQLQREWEAVDYFKNLPQTVAFARVGAVASCQQERQQSLNMGMSLKEMMRAPRYAWPMLIDILRRVRYRQSGSYEDEVALLNFYRDRELEMQAAIKSPIWLEMKPLPGVTNLPIFQSKHVSQIQMLLNMRQMSGAMMRESRSFLGRAAETEALRRLVITALALERHHKREASYPKELIALTPDFIKSPPMDFMDGQPLRYRLSDDGHYVLWSMGLDGVDQGGKIAPRKSRPPGEFPPEDWQPQRRKEADLLWPRPASLAEIDGFRQQQVQEQKEAQERMEEMSAEGRWNRTTDRQAQVESVLKTTPRRKGATPTIQGLPANEWLQNKDAVGTNRLTLDEMLTLKQIITGAEPETATFEVPITYDLLTNVGSLQLYIDPLADDLSMMADEGCNVAWLDCRRATNGNCLLVWDTIYEVPGKHALQMGLWLENSPQVDISGPVAPFVVSNLCQFSVESAVFNPEIGATLRAKFSETNARYSVEINSPDGKRLKTITGSTTNGVTKIFWDLLDEQGRRCTNESFGTVLHITLPDSGRSQTMRGP